MRISDCATVRPQCHLCDGAVLGAGAVSAQVQKCSAPEPPGKRIFARLFLSCMPPPPALDKIKVGVIGTGKMGLLHAAILNSLEGSEVAGFAEPERLVSGILKSMTETPVHSDYRDMLPDIDAAYVTTPVRSHASIAKSCAEAGVGFFVEKPLAMGGAECAELAGTAEACGVPAMVGYHLRYSETFMEAKRLLRDGAVGKIKGARASVYQSQKLRRPSGWRFSKSSGGGGVMIDLGTHLVDLVQWYLGSASKTEGALKSVQGLDVEDEAAGKFVTDSGIECEFEASWNRPGYRLQETTIEIDGSAGRLRVNEDVVELDAGAKKRTYRQQLCRPVQLDVGGPEYTREDTEFVECVAEKRNPSPDAASAARVQMAVDALYRASKSGRTEEVERL